MAAGAFLPLVVFVAIVGGVGIRLLGLWRQTRETPELCLATGLLTLALAMPFTAVGRIPGIAMQPEGRACFSIGLACIATGVTLILFFHYWVFRRESAWGRLLLSGTTAALLASTAYMSTMNFEGAGIPAIKETMRPGTLTLLSTILVCFSWGSVESFRFYAILRRRLAVGLGDPVLANRFLLWGTAGATSFGLLLVIMLCVVRGMTVVREPVPLIAIAVAGCVMSATWYLTFFAPSAYLDFVRRRAARRA